MPRYNPTVHPGLHYHATPEYHVRIEDFLGRLEAAEPGWARQVIHDLIIAAGITKGRALYEELCRRHPAFERSPEPSGDETLIDVSMFLAESFYEDGSRSASEIFDAMAALELAATENANPIQAETTSETLALMEENIDRALSAEVAANEKAIRAQAYHAWLDDQRR